jgi:F-type H+-transporting ATPase subunit delta
LNAVAHDVLSGHPGIAAYLANRAVGRKNKLPVLTAAFGPNASDLFNKFLGVLNQNNRLDLLRWVAAAYQKLRDDAAGRVRVRVTSATPLTDAQLDTLKQTLTTTLKAEPVLDAHTDPDLLGGLVVRVGDRVYDTSVRARLNNLRTHLLASGTHGNR